MSVALRRSPGLGGPITISLLLHLAVAVPLVVWRSTGEPPMPPMYRVDLVAAPPGPRQVGVVRETPAAEAPSKPAPAKAATNDAATRAPILKPEARSRPQTRATPNTTPAPTRTDVSKAPTAGGGPTGGTGTDVATVRTEGIEFPFPGYLTNIVRQIAINFNPRNPGALKAEVFFYIRRNGSVTGFRYVTRSGNLAFDLEAQGAVEAAASAFGPLPAGFSDDILPVYFSFDPARLR